MRKATFDHLFFLGMEGVKAEHDVVAKRLADKWTSDDDQYMEEIDEYFMAFYQLRKERSKQQRASQREATIPTLRLV